MVDLSNRKFVCGMMTMRLRRHPILVTATFLDPLVSFAEVSSLPQQSCVPCAEKSYLDDVTSTCKVCDGIAASEPFCTISTNDASTKNGNIISVATSLTS